MRLSGCGTSPIALQEVKELQHQLQGTTDENLKIHLQEELSITQAKREVAESKRVR